jgi:lysophospholipase L1-like esterase
VFALLTTAGFLALLECGSRVVAPAAIPDPLVTQREADWADIHEYDPLLFWRMRASVSVEGEPFTNRLGLRWPEVAAKQPGEYRILSLGESSTFARRVPPDANYSAVLERELRKVVAMPVRVVNAGVPGYSLLQGVNFLLYRGLDLEPDAVMLYFGQNDFLPVAHRVKRHSLTEADSQLLTDLERFERSRQPLARLTGALVQSSNLARWVVAQREQIAEHESEIVTDVDLVRVPEADRRLLLERVLEFCREGDLKLVIVVPWYRSFIGHAELLRSFAAENDVVLVDLPAELDTVLSREPYFLDLVHPSERGHRMIGGAIARTLLAEGVSH